MGRLPVNQIIAKNIESGMARLGIKAPELARRAKIGDSNIYDILYGRSQNPRIDTLEKIAVDGLGVPLLSLLATPTEDELRREIVDAAGMLPSSDQRRLLGIARALREEVSRSTDGTQATE